MKLISRFLKNKSKKKQQTKKKETKTQDHNQQKQNNTIFWKPWKVATEFPRFSAYVFVYFGFCVFVSLVLFFCVFFVGWFFQECPKLVSGLALNSFRPIPLKSEIMPCTIVFCERCKNAAVEFAPRTEDSHPNPHNPYIVPQSSSRNSGLG